MWVNRLSRLRPLAGAIFTALQAAATQAHGAETPSPRQLPKISVGADVEGDSYKTETAASPKYTQPLRDTPQTITVIPAMVCLGCR
jgi:catecholate siderophore receptor